MRPGQKKKMLVKLIELSVQAGHDITPLVGRPLSYFNWEAVEGAVAQLEAEVEKM